MKERIIKMTKLAMFEQYDGRRDLEICRFFRRDFVGLGLLVNWILISVAYVIGLLAVAVVNMDFLTAHMSEMDIPATIFAVVFIYIIILALYSVIIFTIRRLRYAKAKRNVDKFYDGLSELQDVYRFEDITRGRSERRKS